MTDTKSGSGRSSGTGRAAVKSAAAKRTGARIAASRTRSAATSTPTEKAASAKKVMPAKQVAPAKQATTAKKSSPAKKSASTKSTATKRVAAKRAAPANGATSAATEIVATDDVLEPTVQDAPRDDDEQVVADLERFESTLLDRGRAIVGVTGDTDIEPLRQVLRRHGLTLYPVIALSLLLFVDGFQGLVVGTLGPEISRTLGIGVTTLASFTILKALATSLASIVFADMVGKRPIRAAVSITTAFAWSVCTLATGLVRSGAGLAGISVLDGASSASVGTVQGPLLLDYYPPEIRMRINGLKTAIVFATGLVAPLSITLLVGGFHLTWRGCLIVMALVSLLVSCSSLRLRDPGFGRWDTERIRELVQQESATAEQDPITQDPPLGFFEAARRIFLIPTMRKAITASVVGSMAAPVNIYFNFYLDERWHLGPTGRSVFGFVTGVIAVVLLALITPYADQLFKKDPSEIMSALTKTFAFAGALSLIAVLSPFFVPMIVAYGISQALPQALTPVSSTTFMNIIPPRMRAGMIALLSLVSVAVGETAGNLLLGGLDKRLGLQGAMIFISVLTAPIGIYLFYTMRTTINADLDATVKASIEQEQIASLMRQGVKPSLLACRGIDFSYGQLQVLFDVNFTVDDGEMVALLGTNGAGKSTLLGVVSGLNLPSSGTVRFRGADITYIDTERRVGLGISQVMGGKAVFGPLTVAENLRLFGFAHGKSRQTIDRGIEESFEAFPRLAERRNQAAQTLSGGEQQMLGLSQALILKPQLLCIDELSLGLAPKIVGELLEMVRTIHQRGTAIILVEQSATIALSLVDHAYFMERGQIRFDGRAEELIGRDDLLRSVFLQGASAGIGAAQ